MSHHRRVPTRRRISARRPLAALAVLAVATLAACGAPGSGGPATGDPVGTTEDLSVLEGVTWELTAATVDGETVPVPTARAVTLTFGGSPATVVAVACNSLSGELVDWPDTFAVSGLLQTEMWCEDADLMATEQALATALPRVDSAEGDASSATLTGDGVELTLEPTETSGD